MADTVYVHGDSGVRLEAGALDIEGRNVPIEMVEALVLVEPAHITQPAIMALADAEKPVTWLDDSGRIRARATPPGGGSLDRLVGQMRAAEDEGASLELARAFVVGRLRSEARSLRRGARDGRSVDMLVGAASLLDRHADEASVAANLPQLRAVEAAGTEAYWKAFGALVAAPGFVWRGRSRQPPTDGLNALVSFLSVLWTARCAGALAAHGLDPRLGFLHVPRSGRDSLACDLVEEFRADGPEREALTLVNRGQIRPEHFEPREEGGVRMTDEGRSTLLVSHARRLSRLVRHPDRTHPVPFGLLPAIQAERLARCIVAGTKYKAWEGV